MNHNSQDGPKQHHRRSIRLREYDYSSEGMYYVTLCEKSGKSSFGEVVGREMRLSAIGEIVKQCWEEIPKHFENAQLDRHVIMPNHVHGILMLGKSLVGTRHAVSLRAISKEIGEHFAKPIQGSLPTIMRSFKSAVTKEAHLVGYSSFVWQSRFYDHIIRDGRDLDRIRRYILDNPMNWENDENYPKNIRQDRDYTGKEDWSNLD
jgi:putative transposase